MKTDRELLELAALAAGYQPQGMEQGLMYLLGVQNGWNPLTDDGDALRLAVRLELVVAQQGSRAVAARHDCIDQIEAHGIDPFAATRRAIVRAAAEIGRATKETA